MVFASARVWKVVILIESLRFGVLSFRSLSCRPEHNRKAFAADSILQDDPGECSLAKAMTEEDASAALALLQKSVTPLKRASRSAGADWSQLRLADKSDRAHSISKLTNKTARRTTTTTTTTASETTTTGSTTVIPGIQDYLIFSTTSPFDHHIWKYDMSSAEVSMLISGSGPHTGGIAFDVNAGLLYLAMSSEKAIVRYVMAIRHDQLMMYDFQPVPIAVNVNAEWITVTEESDVMYTDPEAHSINKIYKSTLDLISQGVLQANNLEVVDYVTFYEQYGLPSAALVNENCTCYQRGYIFQVYTDMGHPAGIETYTGSKILWGNNVDGFKRGTVVEGEVEPVPHNGKLAAPVALTHAWDSIFNFFIRAETDFLDASALFLSLNGTLGVPPIPGDVTGALVAIPPVTANFPTPESIVMAWNFVKPRGIALYQGTDETVLVADATGITSMSSAEIIQGAGQIKLVDRPDVVGLCIVKKEDEAIPIMVNRGDNDRVGQ